MDFNYHWSHFTIEYDMNMARTMLKTQSYLRCYIISKFDS